MQHDDTNELAGSHHLISESAAEALWSEEQTTDKLYGIGSARFSDVHIFRAYVRGDGNECILEDVCGSAAKSAYAPHFSDIQSRVGRTGSMICRREAGPRGALVGYIPYYQCESARLGTVCAFYDAETAAVVLMSAGAAGTDLVNAIVTFGEAIPFGKLCAWCGKRAGATSWTSRLKKCPCKLCRYCSTRCQAAHWAAHRPACLPREARRLLSAS